MSIDHYDKLSTLIPQGFLTHAPEVEEEGSVRTGEGVEISHHGEIFQGVVQDDEGRLRRGLVSLPSRIFKSKATFIPERGGTLKVMPPWRSKAEKAARLALTYLGRDDYGGIINVSSTIPIGWGMGSSTSDVTAAILAVANAFYEELCTEEVAHLAVKAETASDSIMIKERIVLFAQREGRVIEELGNALPPMSVLGFNTDPTGRGVDTLKFSPVHYNSWEIESFRPMVGLLRRAIRTQDAHLVGDVATASACINQRYLPKPHFDRLLDIVESVGAVGLQVAHTGTVAGILFDQKDADLEARAREAQQQVAALGFHPFWYFQLQPPAPAKRRKLDEAR